MSVINRVEFCNILNLDKILPSHKDWKPDWRHAVINCGGLSTAIKIANGEGKTTLNNAIYALLTRKSTMMTSTREICAAKRTGHYSHVRVELTYEAGRGRQGRLIGHDIEGEKYVFGLFGNADSELQFYHFQGTLEDCPVVDIEGPSIRVVPNRDFDAHRQQMKLICDVGAAQSVWLERVADHLDMHTLVQSSEYHAKGGGDGAAALFNVPCVAGEAYDSEFFFQHLAPEILVGCMQEFGEKGERSFEDTLFESASPVVETEVKLAAKEVEVKDFKDVFVLLEQAKRHVDRYLECRQHAQTKANIYLAEAALIRDAVLLNPLPGIPRSWQQGGEQTRYVADRLVVSDGDWRMPASLLAELLSFSPSALNQMAGREGIRGALLGSQVIEKPCDNARGTGSGGPQPSGYGMVDALALALKAGKATENWTIEGVQRAIRYAFEAREGAGECNPIRALARAADARLAAMRVDLAEAGAERKAVEAERQELVVFVQRLSAAEAALQSMESSGQFDAADLAAPAEAKIRSEEAQIAARHELERLHTRRLDFQSGRSDYQETSREFGSAEAPEAVLRRLVARHDETKSAADIAKGAWAEADTALEAARDAADTSSSGLQALQHAQSELVRLQPLVTDYAATFGNEPHEGLADSVKADHATALRQEGQLRGRVATLATEIQQLDDLAHEAAGYADVFDGEDPQGLSHRVAFDVSVAAKALQGSRLEQQRAEEELGVLDEGRVALREVYSKFGSDVAIATLEADLVRELGDLQRESSAAAQRAKDLRPLVAALDWFTARYAGPAAPAAVRAERERLRQAALDDRSLLQAALKQLTAERDELATAGTAAGHFARAALEVIGVPALRLHEVVAGLSLDQARRAKVLTQFSQVLHAPVVALAADAATVVQHLQDLKIDYPVFVQAELERYCVDGAISGAEGGVAEGLFWGLPSLTVDILLNPERAAERLAEVDAELERTKATILVREAEAVDLSTASEDGQLLDVAVRAHAVSASQSLVDELSAISTMTARKEQLDAALSPGSKDLIRSAAEFIGAGGDQRLALVRDELAACASAIATLEADMPRLERRASEQAVALIERQVTFVRRGGQVKLGELRSDLARFQESLQDLIAELPRLQQRLAKLSLIEAKTLYEAFGGAAAFRSAAADLDQAKRIDHDAAAERAKCIKRLAAAKERSEVCSHEAGESSNHLARWESRLSAACEYVAAGGREFDQQYAESVERTKGVEKSMELRLRHQFELAQQAVVTRLHAGGQETAEARIRELNLRCGSLDGRITALSESAEKQSEELQVLTKQSGALDQSIARLLSIWRNTRDIDGAISADMRAASALASDSVTVKACRELLAEVRSGRCDELGVVMDDFVANVGDFTINTGLDAFKSLKKDERQAVLAACACAKQIASNEQAKLSPQERSDISPETNDDSVVVANLEKLYRLFEAHLIEAEATLEATTADLVQTRARFHESMLGFTHNIRQNIDLMRKALKPANEPGAAGLILELEVAGPERIDIAIKDVVEVIRDEVEMRRRSRSGGRGVRASAKDENKTRLKKRIGDTFYRSVFVGPAKHNGGPIVRLQHPSIAGGRPDRLTKDISTGQKNAVFLMILIKMADFAQARDELLDVSFSPQARRRVRSSRIVMVDGLFSNLSAPSLIQPSLEAIKQLRGQFQLIGWIHVPQYENDPTLFPSFVVFRRQGKEHRFMAKGMEIVDGEMVGLPMRARQLPSPPETTHVAA